MSGRRLFVVGLVGWSLLLLGCGRGTPHGQPIPPVGDVAQRSFLPSDIEADARQAIAERLSRRERQFREFVEPGSMWRPLRIEQDEIDAGRVTLPALIDIGRELFRIDYGTAQGLGNGLARLKSPLAGKRQSPNLRHVHYRDFGGPDGTRCIACHHVGGQGGGGFRIDNAFLDGDGQLPGSGLERNPRALLGAAILQQLAEEMTRELHAQVRSATKRIARGKSAPLVAKGISFGVLRVTPDGRLDATGIRGISLDIIVRPFGWKGTSASLRQMVVTSLQQNLGLQADELVQRVGKSDILGSGPPGDPDADGVTREFTTGMVTAVTAYLAALAPPIEDMPLDTPYTMMLGRGQRLFEELGCASCHTPELPLDSTVVSLGPTPQSQPRVDLLPLLGGLRKVRLFSDLRRHNMGEALSESRGYLGIPRHQWLTPPLWGLAASAPYLHDGRAGTVHEAIMAHGGEAQVARDAYAKLLFDEVGPLRVYLLSLGRPAHLEFRP
jgi:mono/diheme cytochrome c family protein